MEPWIHDVCEAAIARMNSHAALVELANTDEATFRAFFLAEVRTRMPASKCQTEWFRYDLLVQHDRRNTLIEFKYYITRPLVSLDGMRIQWKGNPGVQNEREFNDCIKKLRTCSHDPIHSKYLVLVYERDSPRASGNTFHGIYGALATTDDVSSVWRTSNGGLCCVVLTIK